MIVNSIEPTQRAGRKPQVSGSGEVNPREARLAEKDVKQSYDNFQQSKRQAVAQSMGKLDVKYLKSSVYDTYSNSPAEPRAKNLSTMNLFDAMLIADHECHKKDLALKEQMRRQKEIELFRHNLEHTQLKNLKKNEEKMKTRLLEDQINSRAQQEFLKQREIELMVKEAKKQKMIHNLEVST